MKRLALAILTLSLLTMPTAYAAPIAVPAPAIHGVASQQAETVRWLRRGPPARAVWGIGRPFPLWSRMIVRDFMRFGLRAPGPGLVWVRSGNQFLLVRSRTGVVVAVR